MRGKEKCIALKEIRKQIADENDIPFVVSQCTHQGECKGTCPKCESELKYLERELAIRQSIGKAVAVVGISVGVCSSLTACSSPINLVTNITDSIFGHQLEGEAQPLPPDIQYEGMMEYIEPDNLPTEPDTVITGESEELLEGVETLEGDVAYEPQE